RSGSTTVEISSGDTARRVYVASQEEEISTDLSIVMERSLHSTLVPSRQTRGKRTTLKMCSEVTELPAAVWGCFCREVTALRLSRFLTASRCLRTMAESMRVAISSESFATSARA